MTFEEWDEQNTKIVEKLSIAWKLYVDEPNEVNKTNHSSLIKEMDVLGKKFKVNKAIQRQIHDAWRKFDRTTAYGCANKHNEYNIENNQQAWNNYNRLLISLGIPPVSTPPIGLK